MPYSVAQLQPIVTLWLAHAQPWVFIPQPCTLPCTLAKQGPGGGGTRGGGQGDWGLQAGPGSLNRQATFPPQPYCPACSQPWLVWQTIDYSHCIVNLFILFSCVDYVIYYYPLDLFPGSRTLVVGRFPIGHCLIPSCWPPWLTPDGQQLLLWWFVVWPCVGQPDIAYWWWQYCSYIIGGQQLLWAIFPSCCGGYYWWPALIPSPIPVLWWFYYHELQAHCIVV